MADPVEAALDVAFEHPDRRVAFGQCAEALANGVGAGIFFFGYFLLEIPGAR